MTDPFRALFLRQVRTILAGDANRDSLFQLLSIVAPELSDGDLEDASKRTRAYKELRLRVHPDKHPNDETATSVFQDLPTFYNLCCRRLHVRSKISNIPGTTATSTTTPRTTNLFKKSESFSGKATTGPTQQPAPAPAPAPSQQQQQQQQSTTSSTPQTPSIPRKSPYPTNFQVTDTWPFLSFSHPIAPNVKILSESIALLELFLAYQCINSRGAVAHRAKPGLYFGWSKVQKDAQSFRTIEEFFSAKYRGARRLEGPDAIKVELMSRGPVISTSFLLSQSFMNSSEFSSLFFKNLIHHFHPLLIVGWKLTSFGEVWLVYPPRKTAPTSMDENLIPIAIGQFGIDTLCLAPESDLQEKVWQSGPYLDLNLSKWPEEWMTWRKCDIHLTSIELEKLSECLGTGFVAASSSMESTRFVVRDEAKYAHSRAYCLKDVQWNPVKKMWKVSVILHTNDL
jgi:hypothetical protein